MWYWLIPLAVIVYAGMAVVSGPCYVRATRERVDDGTFIGYTVASILWPVCLPACGLLTASRFVIDLFCNRKSPLVQYTLFLKRYYKKTHHEIRNEQDHY